MEQMLKTSWLKAAIIRAVKTIVQTAISIIGVSEITTIDVLNNINIMAIDWKFVISSSLIAGILSIITSLGGLPEVN